MDHTHNYRKWLVFNNGLGGRKHAEDLYSAIEKVTSCGQIRCDAIQDIEVKYQVHDETMSSILTINEDERIELLVYLKTHYLPAIIEPNRDQVVIDPEAAVTSLLPGTVTKNKSLFVNRNIKRHILGYGAIGIIGLQFFVIPTNIFGVQYPDFTKTIWIVFFGLLTHIAVRNYKKEFLLGGILYRTVWSITFWLYSLIFLIGGLEIALIDTLEGKGIFSFIITPIIIVAGYVSGWIISFPIYFLNGGKLVTDPNSIRYKE